MNNGKKLMINVTINYHKCYEYRKLRKCGGGTSPVY